MSITDDNARRWNDNVAAISKALDRRQNNGMELFVLCAALVENEKVRTAAPLAMSLIADAVARYRRDRGQSDA